MHHRQVFLLQTLRVLQSNVNPHGVEPLVEQREQHFQDRIDRLLADHYDPQLYAQFQETAAGSAFLLARMEQPIVVARVADEFALDEGYVEYRGVVVDELEQVDLEGEAVVELRLGAWELYLY